MTQTLGEHMEDLGNQAIDLYDQLTSFTNGKPVNVVLMAHAMGIARALKSFELASGQKIDLDQHMNETKNLIIQTMANLEPVKTQ